MATDRSLATLLRALQSPLSFEDTSRLLSSATTLLTLLSNPLNVTVLTVQLLSAPAIWQRPDGQRTSLQVLSVFHNASQLMLERELQQRSQAGFVARNIGIAEWVKAVAKGADERSPRWRHLLVLGGLLTGFEGSERGGLPASLRQTLERSSISAANFALEETTEAGSMGANAICLALAHLSDVLHIDEQRRINHGALLPLLTQAIFFSSDGLHYAYFVGVLDADIVQKDASKFEWSSKSSSFFHVQRLASSPLISALGTLSRLTAFNLENVSNHELLLRLAADLATFTESLRAQWLRNKLSEIDPSEEEALMSEQSIRTTLPTLRHIFQSIMFSVVIIQRALLGRVLGDSGFAGGQGKVILDHGIKLIMSAPSLATQVLHSLRNMAFITARLGDKSFSQHTFVFMTCVDILAQHPAQAEAFLGEIKPAESGRIPEHPFQRNQDLFFLNTAEHFATVLSSESNSVLLVEAATPYLESGTDSRLLEMFEAAHSVMLSVFLASQNQVLTVQYLPLYLESLFQAFPRNLSARQFRLAIKTLVRVTAPPSAISATYPDWSVAIMDTVLAAAGQASTSPESPHASDEPLSAQAAMILAAVDSLPALAVSDLDDRLQTVAEAVNSIGNVQMRDICRARLWEVLQNGEMDVARAARCVAWWNDRGRRLIYSDMSVDPPKNEKYSMSGALQVMSKL